MTDEDGPFADADDASAGAGDDAPAGPGDVGGTGRSAVAPGRYAHYKGPEYEVLGEVRHSETEEVLVLYRALYGERGLWVRPRAMFAGTVEVDGTTVPRFRRIADA